MIDPLSFASNPPQADTCSVPKTNGSGRILSEYLLEQLHVAPVRPLEDNVMPRARRPSLHLLESGAMATVEERLRSSTLYRVHAKAVLERLVGA